MILLNCNHSNWTIGCCCLVTQMFNPPMTVCRPPASTIFSATRRLCHTNPPDPYNLVVGWKPELNFHLLRFQRGKLFFHWIWINGWKIKFVGFYCWNWRALGWELAAKSPRVLRWVGTMPWVQDDRGRAAVSKGRVSGRVV